MRYIVGLLITLGLFILMIFLLFRGGDKQKVPQTSKTLVSYASTNAEVQLTIDGPINAASEHNQVRISVDRFNVTYEQVKGYDNDVTNMQRFANTENAYAVFLKALTHVGFTKGNIDKDVQDERGYCPTGSRYIMELRQDGKSLSRFWATSCGDPKTYAGNTGLTLELFQAQVPGYVDLTEDLVLD